jgi:hypothetical protein
MDTIIEFIRSFPVFILNPKGFLTALDFGDANLWKQMVGFLSLGIGITATMGYVNFRLSPLANLERIDRLFDEKAINLALIMNTVALLVLSHVVFRLLGTKATFNRSCVGLGFTLSFLWPFTSLTLILATRILSPIAGIRWIVIPPLSTSPLDKIDPTVANLFAVSIIIVIDIGLVVYCLFTYYICFYTTHGLARRRTIVGIAFIALGYFFLGRVTSLLSLWISNLLGPAVGHIIDLPQ